MKKSLLFIALVLISNSALAHLLGKKFEDRSTPPIMSAENAEVIAELNDPPGNVSVSPEGRVFITYHPITNPPQQVVEVVGKKIIPFPGGDFKFQSVLSIRVDEQNRLWILDYAHFGFGQPRLYAFDLSTRVLVHFYEFPRSVAGFGSMLNDLQIDAEGKKIYISDNSVLAMQPAILIYDIATQKIREVLRRHESVLNAGYQVYTDGKPLLGSQFFHGLDPLALDSKGEWLYYGPLNGNHLYRIRTQDLNDESLADWQLESRVEKYALKTMTDGIAIDGDGNIYLTDVEHSSIARINKDKKIETLMKDPRFRWPDGFSFGPEGWLYFTCAAIQDVMFKSRSTVLRNGPYHVFRFKY